MEYTESIHEALYTLEYQLIPSYLKNDSFYKMDSIESLSIWLPHDLRKNKLWRDIDLRKMQVAHFSSFPLSYVVIKFPEPMEEPLAYYGMVVRWMGEYRYFTLEKGRDVNFLCEVASKMHNGLGQMHKNFGTYDGDVVLLGFSKYILDRFYPKANIRLEEVEAIYQKGCEAHLDEDWVEAAKYYKEAAECGHVAAMEALGEFYISGWVEEDHEKGLMWLERAAEQGSADACCALGHYYNDGYGSKPNHRLAKEWWEKAIDLGSDAAEMFYEKNFGEE